MFTRTLSTTLLLIILWSACGIAASADALTVVLLPFDDDQQSERMALINDEFAAAFPAGLRVTRALHRLLSERGYQVIEQGDNGLQLSGTVTVAYMMSLGLPTNTVAARYQLVRLSDGAVIASGTAEASDWNNDYATNRLATAIIKQAFK